jgi:hypothetical protein
MKKLVGNYKLGLRPIRLYVNPGHANGNVDLMPEDRGSSSVTIGIDAPWGEAVSVLLHELYEAMLIDLGTRYKLRPSYSEESSDFMFFLSHNQLGEAHERVGYMLAHMLPDFSKAYNKFSPFKD